MTTGNLSRKTAQTAETLAIYKMTEQINKYIKYKVREIPPCQGREGQKWNGKKVEFIL